MLLDQFWLIVLSYTLSGCLECDKGWTGEEADWESRSRTDWLCVDNPSVTARDLLQPH